MGLKLYNSLTRKLETFTPARSDYVGIYACGPTVYNYAHIGNGRMAVAFDLLVRLLRFSYPKVIHVSNITDIDDKIIDACTKTNRQLEDLTNEYTDAYNQDMAAMRVHQPDVQSRATTHIPEMIALISQLIEKNHAYESAGHVLFSVPSFPIYGILSGRNRDEQIAGARVEVAPYKKDPADFVLWKPSTPEQPGWDSPWGRGRPGWHIECSAMAEKHLGLPFDIHGGGADLKFPHHENEIAQSCCAHHHENTPYDAASFARVWIHNGFLTVEGNKMSKSLGNFALPHDLLANGVKGEAMRWALLTAHYRSPLDWSLQRLSEAQKHLDDFYTLLRQAERKGLRLDTIDLTHIDSDILSALNDDLNSPLAQTHLLRLKGEYVQTGDLDTLFKIVASARLMGFLEQTPTEWFATEDQALANIDPDWITAKIKERADAKAARNFTLSDTIRDELLAKGIELKDGREGTTWSLKS